MEEDEECLSPRFYQPCDQYGYLYQHFLEKQDEPILSSESSEALATVPEHMDDPKKPPLKSMLVTGFGMRNWESLRRALLDDDERKQMLLAQHDTDIEEFECESIPSTVSSKLVGTPKSLSKSSLSTSTVVAPTLEYLLKIEEGGAEEYEEKLPQGTEQFPSFVATDEDADPNLSAAMKKARRYLREHKIFEFFQFLTSHLVAQLPDNPIEFLLNLLDKCLLYRSGFGKPPLLYEKPHLEQLFNLMDRMRTGFIDKKQYETGMKTLGICSYDQNPPLNTNGMISKEFFVEEAYECLIDILVDMIRTRGDGDTPRSIMTPPPTAAAPSVLSDGG